MEIQTDEQHRRMIETSIPRLVLSLSIPTTVSQMITIIYNTADTYFVAQIGTSAAAAVGVVFSLMSIIQAVGFGLGMGTSSLISLNLGARREKEAARYASSAVAAAVVFGTVLLVIGLLFLEPMMSILGATKTILPYACGYGRWILIAAPVMCSSFVLNNILRAEGEASLSMCGLCVGGLLNVVLDPLFIFQLEMGIAGAALATVISQVAGFCILLSFFLRGKSLVRIQLSSVSRSGRDYAKILSVGFPTICRQGFGSLSSALLNVQAAAFSDAAVAAITIANKVYMLVRNLILGLGQGFLPVAGYNFGAGRKERVRQAFWFVCLLGSLICAVSAVLLSLHAGSVIAWFRKDDVRVIEIGTQALYYGCAVLPVLGYSTYVNQLYQGLGFSRQATFLASCRQGIFFIPFLYVLTSLLGLKGIAMTQSAADLATFLISVPFQIFFFRHYLQKERVD